MKKKEAEIVFRVPLKDFKMAARALKEMRVDLRKKVTRKNSTAEDFFNYGACIGTELIYDYVKGRLKI